MFLKEIKVGTQSVMSSVERAYLNFWRTDMHEPSLSLVSNAELDIKPPLPPFTEMSAMAKVQAAEDAWNSRDPERVSQAYTENSEWRNRSEFIVGREQIRTFLSRKWSKEQAYRLKKDLWTYSDNRIAVTFMYEWHDYAGRWFRSYGNELWEFASDGLMSRRIASINDVQIEKVERILR